MPDWKILAPGLYANRNVSAQWDAVGARHTDDGLTMRQTVPDEPIAGPFHDRFVLMSNGRRFPERGRSWTLGAWS